MRILKPATLAGSLTVLAIAASSAAQDALQSQTSEAVQDLVGGSTGEDSPDPSTTAVPKAADAEVRVPRPSMSPGASLKFAVVSTDERHGDAREGTRTNHQTIELQFLPKKGKVRVVRYLIRSGEIENDPLAQAMLNASRDLATDFEAGPEGAPLRLADWPGVRAAMLKKLIVDPSAPVESAGRVKQLLESMDPVSAIPFAIPETLMMSDMQGWSPLTPGRHDEPAAVVGTGAGQGRLMAFREVGAADKSACTVRLARSTALDPTSPAAEGGKEVDTLETTADVSTVDGWVVRLTQTRTHKTGGASEVRTWTLTRDDPPLCKG